MCGFFMEKTLDFGSNWGGEPCSAAAACVALLLCVCCYRLFESCPAHRIASPSVLLSSSGPCLSVQGMLSASHRVYEELHVLALAFACCIFSRHKTWACRSCCAVKIHPETSQHMFRSSLFLPSVLHAL